MPNYKKMYANLAEKVDTAIGALIAALVECEKEHIENGEKLIELPVGKSAEAEGEEKERGGK